MLKIINLQFFISYLGFSPFVIILIDKFFLYQFNSNMMNNFITLYALVIFVFIGAMNWNLKKNISNKIILFGIMPSLLSIPIILLFLNSYQVNLLLIIFFILQIFFDKFIYLSKVERKIYFKIRIPLTLLIIVSLFLIQL